MESSISYILSVLRKDWGRLQVFIAAWFGVLSSAQRSLRWVTCDANLNVSTVHGEFLGPFHPVSLKGD
jgi:hypothetical protein